MFFKEISYLIRVGICCQYRSIDERQIVSVHNSLLFIVFVRNHCLDRLQNDSDENIQTIPTIGFNVEVLQYKNIKFQVMN